MIEEQASKDIAMLRANAKVVLDKMGPMSKVEFGYNRDSVEWVSRFIERQRLLPDNIPEPSEQLVNMLGAFLGECVLQNTGGAWQRSERLNSYGVRLGKHKIVKSDYTVFPIAKVRKQFKYGAQSGNSILNFYEFVVDHLANGDFEHKVGQPKMPTLAAPTELQVGTLAAHTEMENALLAQRRDFTKRQTSINASNFALTKAEVPKWMTPDHPLTDIFKQQLILNMHGEVVWGALVQANNLLFSQGSDDCPALLVYSKNPHFDARPHELRAIARKMFELKNTSPEHAETKRIAEMVSNEMEHAMGWQLPYELTQKDVFASAFMVFRKHIPLGILTSSIFPILTHPSTSAVMILPYEFWTLDIIMMWKQGKLAL